MNSTEFPLIYSTHRKILSLMTVNKQLNDSNSKSVEPQGSVGSNPTRSARNHASSRFFRLLAFLFQFCAKPKPLSIASAEVSFEL